jgi:hypothetical protein
MKMGENCMNALLRCSCNIIANQDREIDMLELGKHPNRGQEPRPHPQAFLWYDISTLFYQVFLTCAPSYIDQLLSHYIQQLPGPDTCRSLVQPRCGFGLLLGLWFTRRGSPWTRMCGVWTKGPVRGGLSPPLLPPSLGPQWTRCTRVQLPSLPLPNSSVFAGEYPPAVNGRLGGYGSRVFPLPSPFFDWG